MVTKYMVSIRLCAKKATPRAIQMVLSKLFICSPFLGKNGLSKCNGKSHTTLGKIMALQAFFRKLVNSTYSLVNHVYLSVKEMKFIPDRST